MNNLYNNNVAIHSTWQYHTITNANVFRMSKNRYVVQICEGYKQIKLISTTTYQKAMKISHDIVTAKGVK